MEHAVLADAYGTLGAPPGEAGPAAAVAAEQLSGSSSGSDWIMATPPIPADTANAKSGKEILGVDEETFSGLTKRSFRITKK